MTVLEGQVRRAESPRPGLLSAFAIQRRIISALMIREALRRFGHENLGFFWIMGEPLAMTIGVMAMWSIAGTTHGHVGVVPFALTGYTMLTLWRHLVNNSIHAMRHNAGLLFHRNIRFLDILIARALLESLGGLAAFFAAYLPLSLLGFIDTIYDPLLLIGAWFLMSWYGFAFSMIISAITEFSEAAERFVQPIMYITLPLTGAFYMVSWMPDSVQPYIVWSPLVQVFEMYRAGFFGPSMPTSFNVGYLLLCCVVTTAMGLPLVRGAQKHVKMH